MTPEYPEHPEYSRTLRAPSALSTFTAEHPIDECSRSSLGLREYYAEGRAGLDASSRRKRRVEELSRFTVP